MIRTVALLNLRRLAEQPLRSGLAVLAIAAGSALTVGVVIDMASLDRSLDRFAAGQAGRAAWRVTGATVTAGVEPAALGRVAAVAGVETAAPLVQAVTVVEDATGGETLVPAFGIDCRIEAVIGRFGCDQAAVERAGRDGPLVVSPTLSRGLGDGAVLRTDQGRIDLATAVIAPELDRLNRGRVVVAALPTAQHLFARDSAYDVILVVPEPGADLRALGRRIAEAAGAHNVVRPADQPFDSGFAGTLLPLLFMTSLFALAVGAQLVHNTLALTLEERRRDLAVAGALGATPRTLLAGALTEAATLGLVGGGLGVVAGIALAGPLVDSMSAHTERFTGVTVALSVPAFAVVAGLGLGVATAVLAAIGPARRAAAADVSAELQGRTATGGGRGPRRARRAVLYAALGGAGILLGWLGQRDGAIEPWQPPIAQLGFLAAAVLLFRATAHAAPPLLARLGDARWLRDGPARLALGNLVGDPKRTGAMTLAVAAAVGTGVLLSSTNRAIVVGSEEFSRRLGAGTVHVSTLPANNSLAIEAKVSPAAEAALAAVPGVAAVRHEYAVEIDHPSLGAVVVTTRDSGPADFQVWRGGAAHAVLDAGDVLIGSALARRHGLRPGDEVDVPGRTGFQRLRVGAIWADPNNIGSSMVLPPDRFDALFGPRPPLELWAVPEPGVTLTDLADRIEAAGVDPDLTALDPDRLADAYTDDIGTFLTPFWALQRGLLVVAFVATASTLLLVGVQRRREHGLLAAVGLPPRGLARMTTVEAALVGAAGTVLGTLAGLGTFVAMMLVSPILTGLYAPMRVDVAAPLVYGLVATACVVVAAGLPALRTARLDPVVALRYE